MKHSATDIALKYLGALSEGVRKKNTAKYSAKAGAETALDPDEMGDSSELGGDDLSSILDSHSGENEMGTESAENEMGDDFTGDGKDAGSEPNRAKVIDQETKGDSPTMALFKKKSKPLFKG